MICILIKRVEGAEKMTLALRRPKAVVRPGRWSFFGPLSPYVYVCNCNKEQIFMDYIA